MTQRLLRFLTACAEGCYKHHVNGKWVCCKCGC
jgi:hypothetical protein